MQEPAAIGDSQRVPARLLCAVGRIVCDDQWLIKEKLFGLKLGYLMSIDAFALVSFTMNGATILGAIQAANFGGLIPTESSSLSSEKSQRYAATILPSRCR